MPLDIKTGKEEYGDDNAAEMGIKGVLKAKMLAKSVQEKVARQRDPTKHGFSNPFRNAKVGNYGAVKMGDFDEEEFYYEDEEFGENGPTPEQILAMQIRQAKANAPKEDRKGRIVYPNGGEVIDPVKLKDRYDEDQKQMEKERKEKWDKKKRAKWTKEEVRECSAKVT